MLLGCHERNKHELCYTAAMMEESSHIPPETTGMCHQKQIHSKSDIQLVFFLYTVRPWVLGTTTEAAFQQPGPLPPLLSHIT